MVPTPGMLLAAAKFDVIAARRIRVCRPAVPDRATTGIHVIASGAVLVVRRQVLEQRNLAGHGTAPPCPSDIAPPCRWSSRAPAGNARFFEFSRIRTVSHALAASTTTRAAARCAAAVGLVDECHAVVRGRLAQRTSLTMASVTMSRLPVARAGGRCTVVD